MRKGILSFVALSLVALLITYHRVTNAESNKKLFSALNRKVEFRKGEVLVKLRNTGRRNYSVQTTALVDALSKHFKGSFSASSLQMDRSFVVVTAKQDLPMETLVATIQSNPVVEYAEPNFIYYASEVMNDIPNDPNFGQNWGLLNLGQKDSKGQEGIEGRDIGATKTWGRATGSKDIVVAIIDTGVDTSHEDLKNNIWSNPNEVAENGIDDDLNGFVDDVHGWNFEGKNNNPMDDNRHGTHCAGTIGAEGNNGVGTAGVNWHVSILPLKFLSSSGSGSLSDAVDAIKYATKMHVNIMSNSWGGGGYSRAMFEAIRDARDQGILFVAAAGNDGNDNDLSPSYPASYELENVISVAATDNRDQKASWSNYGATHVHLAAPGVNIYSTLPMDKGGYGVLSGTSMACPHVAGAAALLWASNPMMSAVDIKTRLLATVDPVRGLKRKVASKGRLNVYNAVENIVPDRKGPPADSWRTVAKSIESKHPYQPGTVDSVVVSHPGAKFIRLHFSKINVEKNYDYVRVNAPNGETIEEVTGNEEDYTTDYIEGDQATVTLSSDNSIEAFGYTIDHYDIVE